MHNSSGGEKVTIVAHSMGGIVSLYFLNEAVTQEWKDQYINAWVTLSGAWSGGNSGLSGVITGPLHLAYRTFQSSVWLFPKPSVWNNTVLVTSTTRNNDYEDFFFCRHWLSPGVPDVSGNCSTKRELSCPLCPDSLLVWSKCPHPRKLYSKTSEQRTHWGQALCPL